jgi:hypothetical protein
MLHVALPSVVEVEEEYADGTVTNTTLHKPTFQRAIELSDN